MMLMTASLEDELQLDARERARRNLQTVRKCDGINTIPSENRNVS